MSAAVSSDAIRKLDDRLESAMTEPMHVAQLAPGMYEVTTLSGETYHVDPSLGACECPDHEYNVGDLDGVRCKHALAVVLREGPHTLEPGR